MSSPDPSAYRATIRAIPIGIAIFGTGIVATAIAIGSRQLLKDGIDWIYDVGFYGIAAVAFGRGPHVERWAAVATAAVLAAASGAISYDIFIKLTDPRPIQPFVISFSAISAVVVALTVAGLLYRFRSSYNPLIEATWFSARNDCIATAIQATAQFAVRLLPIRAPEIALDCIGIALNAQAIYAILREVRVDARRRSERLM